MITKRFLTVLIAALQLTFTAAARQNPDLLNYSKPSTTWMGALPMGNGRIGTMIYGGVDTETIALNEITLWSGRPDPEANNLCGPEVLKKIRSAFFAGDVALGNQLGNQYLSGHGKSFGTHLPLGSLKLQFMGSHNNVSCYNRQLNMNDAIAHVSYNDGGTHYSREYFTSNPDQVSVIRLTTNHSKSLSLNVSLNLLRYGAVKVTTHELDVTGDARFDKGGPGGVKYRALVKVIANGGQQYANGDHICIEHANEVIILLDIRTNFNSPDYQQLCQQTVEHAASMKYSVLKQRHTADFSRLYNRMQISLGQSEEKQLDTDSLYNIAHKGHPSPSFDALFFQYGRYMLLSASRENSPLPANLQGIWNDNLACNMPWTCDYHLDINIEQNYWSANIANMPETNMPLFNYLELLAKYGSKTARQMYGCRGWVAHTINNVWGDTAPGSGVSWAMNVTAGAWMATQLWAHYDFTRDDEWLRTQGYPLIKQTALFFLDYMVNDPHTGYLVTGPSISPENSFRYVDGHDYSLSMMPTIDRAVVHDIYKACIKASEILNVDDTLRTRLQHDINLLPPYRVGSDGTLNEWLLNVSRSDPAHRHASHLLGLYPFGEISPKRTPQLAEACRVFLDKQTKQQRWEDTEWTRGNMINFYARLKQPEEAYRGLVGLYTGFMRENLMTVSPKGVAGAADDIFSFDATEAAVSGTCEMLLQSYNGYLDFLPSLPKAWQTGSVRGICARGAITASFSWKDGRVTKAQLYSKFNQKIHICMNGKEFDVTLKKGNNKIL